MKESVLWPILQQARNHATSQNDTVGTNFDVDKFERKFAELIVKECVEQVEQAKNSPFVSLDDANRMKHFVDVTKKKIQKHFGVEE